MTTDLDGELSRFREIKKLFEEYGRLRSSDRPPFFDALRARDPDAASHLQELLESASFLPDDAVDEDGPEQPDSHLAELGDFDHYTPIEEIGRGAQAVVYLAEDTRLHRKVALKVLSDAWARSDERLQRFQREARLASRLDHPNIATIYETGMVGRTAYLAMRHVPGRTLAVAIAAGEGLIRDVARVMALVETAARALHTAHEAGIVHRDIKPGNIMLTPEDEPVLLDFGVARDSAPGAATLTLAGDVFGTPAYMAPEQIAGDPAAIDRRTDVWALGVTLHECLTLRKPFEAPTREGLSLSILHDAPPDPRRLNPAVSRDLAVVIRTAMEKDPNRRYQTALDLAEDLRRVRMREPIVAKPAGPLTRLQRWAQRNPALAAAVVGFFAVLVIGLVVALFLLAQRDRALAEVTTERNEKQTALNAKTVALEDYERLGDLTRLKILTAASDSLWPAEPRLVHDMRQWIEHANELRGRLGNHEATLERLSGELSVEQAAGEDLIDAAQSRARISAESPSSGFRDPMAALLRALSISELFKYRSTKDLVTGIKALSDPDPHVGLIANMRGRLAFAESVERETIGKYEDKWASAIRSIADRSECPKYGGLRIAPQLGLIPIDRDSASGLWEFAHLQTTTAGADPMPKRGRDGRLKVTKDTGVVFVLVPGGSFRMGAVKPDSDEAPGETNLDPEAAHQESPVTQVELRPFFLSKFEVTQAQWARVTGRNPSTWNPLTLAGRFITLIHPVEMVSWNECDLWLGRLGLRLPTEAQWEYAARGGTTTPRWCATEAIAKAANVADETLGAGMEIRTGTRTSKYETWTDKHSVHAPVGSFEPNPFGLHDVLGNVYEWCLDGYGGYDQPVQPGDGLRRPTSSERVFRGGSFAMLSMYARSAARNHFDPVLPAEFIGVRPVMAVAP